MHVHDYRGCTIYRYLNPPLVGLYNPLIKVRPFEMAIDFVLLKTAPNVGIPGLEGNATSMEQDWDMRAKVNALIAAPAMLTSPLPRHPASRGWTTSCGACRRMAA